jgi:hypothetical protein
MKPLDALREAVARVDDPLVRAWFARLMAGEFVNGGTAAPDARKEKAPAPDQKGRRVLKTDTPPRQPRRSTKK